MCKLILSVDSGKYLTKAAGITESGDDDLIERKKVHLRSKMYDLADGDVELAGESFIVNYKGRNVILGEQGTIGRAGETNKATCSINYAYIQLYYDAMTSKRVYRKDILMV